MNDRKLDPSRFKFEPYRYLKEKMEMGEAVQLLPDCDEVIIIDPDNFEEPIKENKVKDTKDDVINRLIASTYIIDAIIKELKDDCWIFVTHCQNYSNLSAAIIQAYQKLNYRERSMMAAKLGFDKDYFYPVKKLPYIDISYNHMLSSPETSSRIVRKALRKISMEITAESRGEEVWQSNITNYSTKRCKPSMMLSSKNSSE